jgi:hypothetical protein
MLRQKRRSRSYLSLRRFSFTIALGARDPPPHFNIALGARDPPPRYCGIADGEGEAVPVVSG